MSGEHQTMVSPVWNQHVTGETFHGYFTACLLLFSLVPLRRLAAPGLGGPLYPIFFFQQKERD